MNEQKATSHYHPIDKGMPQERTLLSWRRTSLTIVILAFALGRIALETSTFLAFILAALGLILVTVVLFGASTKYGEERSEYVGGKTTALLAFSVFALAVTEIALLLMS